MAKKQSNGRQLDGVVYNLTPTDLIFVDWKGRTQAVFPNTVKEARVSLSHLAEAGDKRALLERPAGVLGQLGATCYRRVAWLNERMPLVELTGKSQENVMELMRVWQDQVAKGYATLKGFPSCLQPEHSKLRQQGASEALVHLEYFYITTVEVAMVAAQALNSEERGRLLIPVRPLEQEGVLLGYRGLLPLDSLWRQFCER